jgi:HlyD family secretion protein
MNSISGRTPLRWGTPAILFLLIGGLLYHWNSTAHARRSTNQAIAAVPSGAVSVGDLKATVVIQGTVAAMNSAYLLAPRILGSRSGMNRGGDVSSVVPGGDFNLVLLSLAKAGSHVSKGDVVAQFDPQNQLLRLDDYKDSVIQLESNVKNLMASLAALKETHDQSVRAAKAAWESAILDLQTAPVHAQLDVEKLKLAQEEAEATYKQLVYESSLVEESQQAQIRMTELNRDQSRIELKRAQQNVEKMTVRTPMDGIVVMGSIVRNGEFGQIREGDQIFAGQPFMSIVDPRSMVLNAAVNQVDGEKLRLGMKAVVRLDAYPDVALPGTLTGVGAMAKTSTFRAGYVGEIPIRINIERLDPRLLPDLTGSAEVVLQSETDTVIAPRAAIFEEDGREVVYVKTADGWIKRPVQLGLESNTAAAVHDGLRKGEIIAYQRPI